MGVQRCQTCGGEPYQCKCLGGFIDPLARPKKFSDMDAEQRKSAINGVLAAARPAVDPLEAPCAIILLSTNDEGNCDGLNFVTNFLKGKDQLTELKALRQILDTAIEMLSAANN